jgi:hypothetical protein
MDELMATIPCYWDTSCYLNIRVKRHRAVENLSLKRLIESTCYIVVENICFYAVQYRTF